MDMPCLQFCAAIREGGSALAMIPDSKYGYRATENNLAVSLINTSNNPDPFPDRGLHTINIALVPGRDDAKMLEDTASALNHPTYFLSNNSHPGSLPMERSFLNFTASSTVLSAVLPEENGMTLRWYENGGKEDKLTFRFSKPVASATTTDLNGHEVPSDAAVNGCEVTLTAKTNALGQMTVTF
jgi:alpha-mannosidase